MRTNFSKKQLAVACALALGIVSGTAIAQNHRGKHWRRHWGRSTSMRLSPTLKARSG